MVGRRLSVTPGSAAGNSTCVTTRQRRVPKMYALSSKSRGTWAATGLRGQGISVNGGDVEADPQRAQLDEGPKSALEQLPAARLRAPVNLDQRLRLRDQDALLKREKAPIVGRLGASVVGLRGVREDFGHEYRVGDRIGILGRHLDAATDRRHVRIHG